MILTLLSIVDILLWIVMAGSVAYVLFFALVSFFHIHKRHDKYAYLNTPPTQKFLILFPAYKEDAVILSSVESALSQDYSQELFHVAVISDHMQEETNKALASLPITLFQPVFEKSSKAKALQYAMSHINDSYDYVVILDADNIVKPRFLRRLNATCLKGYKAIQCHRCAKNSDNDVAILDGVSEEINNTLFRKAHNHIGLPAALIGSGMCFDFNWFGECVNHLSTAGEDREIEDQLLRQRIFIKYDEDIHVFDEKVSSQDNFQRQRLRWMSAQIQALLMMLPHAPKALVTGNIAYVNKTIQNMVIPRSILLFFTFAFSLLLTAIAPVRSLKWWALFVLTCLALFVSIPKELRKDASWGKLKVLADLVWRMVRNIRHLDKKNENFIHTEHKS